MMRRKGGNARDEISLRDARADGNSPQDCFKKNGTSMECAVRKFSLNHVRL
jgi:hypothetical protein